MLEIMNLADFRNSKGGKLYNIPPRVWAKVNRDPAENSGTRGCGVGDPGESLDPRIPLTVELQAGIEQSRAEV